MSIVHAPRSKIFGVCIFQLHASVFCKGSSKTFCYKNVIPTNHRLLLKLLEMCIGKLNKYSKFHVILLSFEE